MNRFFAAVIFLFIPSVFFAQSPMPPKSAGEILHDIKRLQVTGKVLYMAAHPDDENQRIITWLGRGQGLETGYLALTRGDGGQNLIGNEKGPSLGMLRTQELLGARRIDAGKQFFTRAYDFGYSKTPEETLTKWDKDAILGDVVWVIRNFRPDVIITRFATPEKGGGGHGHHTTSAILAHEAFDLAGDPTAFPEQLEFVDPWQPKRLFWNNYWVFRRYEPTEEELEGIFPINIGEYNPLLGMSYGEIASQARSMHKCQAFGASWIRGSMTEYLEYEKGDKPVPRDFMSGIETGWARLGLPQVDGMLEEIVATFDPSNPSASVAGLLAVRREIQDGYRNPETSKSDLDENAAAVDELILYCSGIWIEANTSQAAFAKGDTLDFQIETLKRTDLDVSLTGIHTFTTREGEPDFHRIDSTLSTNESVQRWEFSIAPEDLQITQPYWLSNPNPVGIFEVSDPYLIGNPENPYSVGIIASFEISGQTIERPLPLTHRYVDRAVGELYRPAVITPPLTVNVTEPVYLFGDQSEKEVRMVAKGHAAGTYTITFEVPDGWNVSPEEMEMSIDQAGQEIPITVSVTPPSGSSVGDIVATIHSDQMDPYSLGYEEIAYGHIPTQVWFPQAKARLASVSLQKKGNLIGYLVGSGDQVPEALEQVGYTVEMIDPNTVTTESLKKYDALVCGIRAYNTLDRISYVQSQILDYIEQGGTYIVQYQTSYGMKEEQIGPFPMSLGRGRISVEKAELTFLDPEHPALTSPNQLGPEDFEGWVQERGLYFASEWDEALTPLLEGHDPGEDNISGALLVGEYGEGHFVYTGISFFRELPAGVPGAFRLFVNLISLGQDAE